MNKSYKVTYQFVRSPQTLSMIYGTSFKCRLEHDILYDVGGVTRNAVGDLHLRFEVQAPNFNRDLIPPLRFV